MRFGEVLINLGFIDEKQLDQALKEQDYNIESAEYSEYLGNILLRNRVINDIQHERALIEYFKILSTDNSAEKYVRDTAEVAYNAMLETSKENTLSEETKLAILIKINEYEERIIQFKNSMKTLGKFEQKKVIKQTIKKEKIEIEKTKAKIKLLQQDLEKFS